MQIKLIEDAHVAGRGYCMAGNESNPFFLDVTPSEADRLVNREGVAVFVDPIAPAPDRLAARPKATRRQNAMLPLALSR